MVYQLNLPTPNISEQTKARPFLKWAGGKSQLLAQFEEFYPPELKQGGIEKYVEPFVGSGAVFFDIAQTYSVKSFFLYDVNAELIIAYKVIQRNVEGLIDQLSELSKNYKVLDNERRKKFFYQIRENFNHQRKEIAYQHFSQNWISRAAMLIFLNRTCFNGLFRLNSQGEFNVPHGRYKNPRIVDEENLLNVARVLQRAEIQAGDFESCASVVDENTFVYFDPPYRPISQTSSFTSYSKFDFGENEQVRLARFFLKLDRERRAKLMLSNSDPTNEDPGDNFFKELYKKFFIQTVSANRMINSNGAKRGKIRELLITNYKVFK
jgi:DNA adenine methylase